MLCLLLLVAIFLSAYPSIANASSIGMTLTPPRATLPDSGQHRNVIETNQQVVISTDVRNPYTEEELQPVTLLIEIRDGDGVSIFLAYQSTMLRPLQNYTAGFSWSIDKPEEYEIRAFAISDFQNPMVLSTIRTSPIIVTDDPELLNNAEKITLYDRVPMPDFHEQSDMNYTIKQIADQHELLCGEEYSDFNSILRSMWQGDEMFPYWFPQRVQFHYLQSNETFYRQPCTVAYLDETRDEVYIDYVMRSNETVPLDTLDLAELFQIETLEQVLEYLAYFAYHGSYYGGNAVGTDIIPTVDSYYSIKVDCDLAVDSPVRFIRVTEQNDSSYIVELNGSNAGSIEYYKWRFELGSAPLLLTTTKLGHCPA